MMKSYPKRIISLRASFDRWWDNFHDVTSGKSSLTDKGKSWLAVQALAETTHAWVVQRKQDLGRVHVDTEIEVAAQTALPVLAEVPQILPEEARLEFEGFYRKYRKIDPSNSQSLDIDRLLTRKDGGYLYGHPNSCWAAYKEALLKHNLIRTE